MSGPGVDVITGMSCAWNTARALVTVKPDVAVMTDVRDEHGFGRIHSYAISHPWQANLIESEFTIARVLDVPIDCVEKFKERTGLTQ